MIETISIVLFILAILFVALGPKRSSKKDTGPDSSDKKGLDSSDKKGPDSSDK